MRYLIIFLSIFAMSTTANADAFDWRIEVSCNAHTRKAQVSAIRCDGNASDETRCEPHKVTVSKDARIVTVAAPANSHYNQDPYSEMHVSMISNHPIEFGCRMLERKLPFKPGVDVKTPAVFLRIERYPTTWRWGGQCGASAYSVALTVQANTSVLDFERPAERIEMVGRCGDGKALVVFIDVDTGEISYSEKPKIETTKHPKKPPK